LATVTVGVGGGPAAGLCGPSLHAVSSNTAASEAANENVRTAVERGMGSPSDATSAVVFN
jgi:hypothetical protein